MRVNVIATHLSPRDLPLSKLVKYWIGRAAISNRLIAPDKISDKASISPNHPRSSQASALQRSRLILSGLKTVLAGEFIFVSGFTSLQMTSGREYTVTCSKFTQTIYS
jgi:hypothetical protein